MGGGSTFFGLFVILVVILGTENGVKGAPLPSPDLCIYGRRHVKHPAETTTAAPTTEKPKEADRVGRLKELLDMFWLQENEAEKLEAEKKKEKETKKVPEPVGFASLYEFWNDYMALVTKMMQSF